MDVALPQIAAWLGTEGSPAIAHMYVKFLQEIITSKVSVYVFELWRP